jgi:hypothetical protein
MDGREEVGQVELQQDRGPAVRRGVRHGRAARDEPVRGRVRGHAVEDQAEDLPLEPAQLALRGADLPGRAVALGDGEPGVRAVVAGAGQQQVAELRGRPDAQELAQLADRPDDRQAVRLLDPPPLPVAAVGRFGSGFAGEGVRAGLARPGPVAVEPPGGVPGAVAARREGHFVGHPELHLPLDRPAHPKVGVLGQPPEDAGPGSPDQVPPGEPGQRLAVVGRPLAVDTPQREPDEGGGPVGRRVVLAVHRDPVEGGVNPGDAVGQPRAQRVDLRFEFLVAAGVGGERPEHPTGDPGEEVGRVGHASIRSETAAGPAAVALRATGHVATMSSELVLPGPDHPDKVPCGPALTTPCG